MQGLLMLILISFLVLMARLQKVKLKLLLMDWRKHMKIRDLFLIVLKTYQNGEEKLLENLMEWYGSMLRTIPQQDVIGFRIILKIANSWMNWLMNSNLMIFMLAFMQVTDHGSTSLALKMLVLKSQLNLLPSGMLITMGFKTSTIGSLTVDGRNLLWNNLKVM